MDIEDCILQIKEEIGIINDELGEVGERLATLEADVRWIRGLTALIAGGIASMLARMVLLGI